MSKKLAAAPTAAQLAAALGFVAKATEKDFIRDDSPDGAHHAVRATLTIEVDGTPIIREYEGTTDTGHASVRASSVGAKPGEVLAYVASKLSGPKRAELYRELAEIYAANDGKLPVTEEAVKEADEALSRLRQKSEQTVRGTFRVSARQVERQPEPVATATGKRRVIVADSTGSATKSAKSAKSRK